MRSVDLPGIRFIRVRMLKQSQAYLGCKNWTDGGVDCVAGNAALLNQICEHLYIGPASHVHVDSSSECAIGRVASIARKSVSYQVTDRHCIAHYESWKLPGLAQNVSQ